MNAPPKTESCIWHSTRFSPFPPSLAILLKQCLISISNLIVHQLTVTVPSLDRIVTLFVLFLSAARFFRFSIFHLSWNLLVTTFMLTKSFEVRFDSFIGVGLSYKEFLLGAVSQQKAYNNFLNINHCTILPLSLPGIFDLFRVPLQWISNRTKVIINIMCQFFIA